jgi:hypothetical protein
LAVSIVFQYKNARPFRVIRIVFDHHGAAQAFDDVTNKHTISREFLITVIRHAYVPASHERADLLQGLAQSLDPFWYLIIPSGVRCPANACN